MSASLDYTATAQSLTLENVEALNLRVNGIAVLKQGGNAEDELSSSWVTIELTEEAKRDINVLTLADDEALLIAQGELEVGNYKNLRLLLDAATIVLKEDATVGGQLFEAGVEYSLRVPSGVVKLPLSKFEIDENGVSTLELELRERPSLANIVATGSGELMMTPVLHIK